MPKLRGGSVFCSRSPNHEREGQILESSQNQFVHADSPAEIWISALLIFTQIKNPAAAIWGLTSLCPQRALFGEGQFFPISTGESMSLHSSLPLNPLQLSGSSKLLTCQCELSRDSVLLKVNTGPRGALMLSDYDGGTLLLHRWRFRRSDTTPKTMASWCLYFAQTSIKPRTNQTKWLC